MAGLEDLYREIILDHYRAPRNRGELPVPPAHRRSRASTRSAATRSSSTSTSTTASSATCAPSGQGCSISQASTSMMSAAVKGQPIEEARHLIRAFKSLMSIHESKLDGEVDGDGDAAAPRRRRARGPRGPPGGREVPGPDQVRHPGLEHPRAGPRRVRGRERLTWADGVPEDRDFDVHPGVTGMKQRGR